MGKHEKPEKRTPRAQRDNDRKDNETQALPTARRKNDAQAYCPRCSVWYDSAKDSSHAGH